MQAGNLAHHLAAWRTGRCMRAGHAAWRGLLWAWRLFGGERLLLNAMALCGIACAALLMWWAVLEPIVPLQSAEVLDPPNGVVVVDRDVSAEFRVTRRICMSRGAWGHVSRYYIGMDGIGLEFKLAGRDSLFLPAGCHVRARIMEVPKGLPPGEYVFRSAVQFCNRVRCEDGWAQEVQVHVTGRWPLRSSAPPSLFRDPM